MGVLIRMSGTDVAGQRFNVVSEFDTFVRPTLNPTLTPFSQELCGITQVEVDGAPDVTTACQQWLQWLRSFSLVDEDGKHTNTRWAVCTWSDADFGSQLAREFKHKSIVIPPCCERWIDLSACSADTIGENPAEVSKRAWRVWV